MTKQAARKDANKPEPGAGAGQGMRSAAKPGRQARGGTSVVPRGAEPARHERSDDSGPNFPVLAANPALSRRRPKRGYYGWKPDLPDMRDHIYAAPMFVRMPATVDLRGRCPPVYDQGKLGSCTGNAIAAAVQFERMRQALREPHRVPSRLFIYYNERDIEGTIDIDSGAHIRDGIKSVASQGDCFESGPAAWPYDIAKFRQRPPQDCYAKASKDRTVSYSRLVPTLDQFRGCLASGYPFVFGFTIYDSFESDAVAKSGVLPMPASGERVVGGHAVMAVGYDDRRQRFLLRNSWGKHWGMQGYFTIPYGYLTNPRLAGDFWTIRLMSATAPAALPRKRAAVAGRDASAERARPCS